MTSRSPSASTPARRLARRAGAGTRRGGFTLIELLIVVAIIAILAAIAVPNFLEAQVRAKVARAQADLRTLHTALAAYQVDTNKLPTVGNPNLPSSSDIYVPFARRLAPLTTPIAYISSLPDDPFYSTSVAPTNIAVLGTTYVYCPGNLYFGASLQFSGQEYRNSIFSIASRGPDKNLNAGGYCMAHPTAYVNGTNTWGLYDPTNGTVSEGDIWRLGGSRLGSAN